jgi:UDP-glucuronate decarboxylase
VSNFIVQALLGRDITVYGEGLQTRAFCYVDDLIDGLIKLMATGESVTGPINIGNPGEFSILQLATMVVDLTGSRSRTVHRPLPQNDPRQRRPDISRAQELLSWQPRMPLKEGLIRTIAYFEKLLSDNRVRDSLVAELSKSVGTIAI